MRTDILNEEQRFTEAFYSVLRKDPDKAPGPTQINRALGKHKNPEYHSPMNVLNGRMVDLRRRLLLENGFVKESHLGRWRKA